LAATAAIGAPLLVDLEAGDSGDDRFATWLEGLAAGQVAAAVGFWPEAQPVAGADGATLCALGRPADGPDAALFIMAADEGAASPACTIEPVTSLDPTRRLARVVPAVGVRPVATGERAAELAGRTARRAAVATAAELVGLSERLITIGAEYARSREQFGRPIGSFQAVKHLLAGAQVKLEFARPAVYAAAWSIDADEPDAGRRASAAKAQASEVASEAARVALQVHGAIGYTWECDLQLFLKRSWALAAAWGSAAEHRRRVLDSLLADRTAAAQGTAKA
jgi:Acyl-CoA dehydrogenase, C-terminal domain